MSGRTTPPGVLIEISELSTVRVTYVKQPAPEQDDVVTDIGDVRLIIPVAVAEELIDHWVTTLTLSSEGA